MMVPFEPLERSSIRSAVVTRHVLSSLSPLGVTRGFHPQPTNGLPTPQPIILSRDMAPLQWYVHLSREKGADLTHIKQCITELRRDCAQRKVSLLVAFGPTLLNDITKDVPDDFQAYETFKSKDGSGKEAKGTQEELLLWLYGPKKDDLWKVTYEARERLKGHMRVARETQTFIYGDSLDMTGFQDGTGNPTPASKDEEVAIVPAGRPGGGGSFLIAQRWVHDLSAFNKLPVEEQEKVFGRTKDGSVKLEDLPNNSHVMKMDYRNGNNADDSKEKKDEITRRSTPYAHPAPKEGGDGVTGLYFIGFCRTQKPLRDRMLGMYGLDGSVRDRLTDFSNPASGSYYFAPSVDVLDSF